MGGHLLDIFCENSPGSNGMGLIKRSTSLSEAAGPSMEPVLSMLIDRWPLFSSKFLLALFVVFFMRFFHCGRSINVVDRKWGPAHRKQLHFTCQGGNISQLAADNNSHRVSRCPC